MPVDHPSEEPDEEHRTRGDRPDGDQVEEAAVTTARLEQRSREDREYVPVIVKRSDEARRHPDDILVVAIDEGLEQLERPVVSLALSAVGAGLILGFTAMAVAVGTVATTHWPTGRCCSAPRSPCCTRWASFSV